MQKQLQTMVADEKRGIFRVLDIGKPRGFREKRAKRSDRKIVRASPRYNQDTLILSGLVALGERIELMFPFQREADEAHSRLDVSLAGTAYLPPCISPIACPPGLHSS